MEDEWGDGTGTITPFSPDTSININSEVGPVRSGYTPTVPDAPEWQITASAFMGTDFVILGNDPVATVSGAAAFPGAFRFRVRTGAGLTVGDEVAIVQTQAPTEALIGKYEFLKVKAITSSGPGTRVEFTTDIRQTYSTTGKVKLQRVFNGNYSMQSLGFVGGSVSVFHDVFNPLTGLGGVVFLRGNFNMTGSGNVCNFFFSETGYAGGASPLFNGDNFTGVTLAQTAQVAGGGGGYELANDRGAAGGGHGTTGHSPETLPGCIYGFGGVSQPGFTYGDPTLLNKVTMGAGGGGGSGVCGQAGGNGGGGLVIYGRLNQTGTASGFVSVQGRARMTPTQFGGVFMGAGGGAGGSLLIHSPDPPFRSTGAGRPYWPQSPFTTGGIRYNTDNNDGFGVGYFAFYTRNMSWAIHGFDMSPVIITPSSEVNYTTSTDLYSATSAYQYWMRYWFYEGDGTGQTYNSTPIFTSRRWRQGNIPEDNPGYWVPSATEYRSESATGQFANFPTITDGRHMIFIEHDDFLEDYFPLKAGFVFEHSVGGQDIYIEGDGGFLSPSIQVTNAEAATLDVVQYPSYNGTANNFTFWSFDGPFKLQGIFFNESISSSSSSESSSSTSSSSSSSSSESSSSSSVSSSSISSSVSICPTIPQDDFTGNNGDPLDPQIWDDIGSDEMFIWENRGSGWIENGGSYIVDSRTLIQGNFDVQVDWGYEPSAGEPVGQYFVGLYVYYDPPSPGTDIAYIERRSGYQYRTFIQDGSVQTTATSATSGSFRITREDATLTTYYSTSAGWTQFYQFASPSISANDVTVRLYVNSGVITSNDSRAWFDNLLNPSAGGWDCAGSSSSSSSSSSESSSSSSSSSSESSSSSSSSESSSSSSSSTSSSSSSLSSSSFSGASSSSSSVSSFQTAFTAGAIIAGIPGDRTIRQVVFEAAMPDDTGNFIKATLGHQAGNDYTVYEMWIGEADSSGEIVDFVSSPTQITFNGGSPSASVTSELESDNISYSFDGSNDLLISSYVDRYNVGLTTNFTGYRRSVTGINEASTVDVVQANYIALAGRSAAVIKLEYA